MRRPIRCEEMEMVDWGFRFFTETEIDAYRAAYLYRHGPGVEVKFAGGAKRWMVTVFNERGIELGFNK